MTIRVTILGCGSSGGVPRVGGEWGACDPANPKNRRRRCALLVERISAAGTTRVLIDTGPDMREQLLSADVGDLDAVAYTHAHADHLHGIDDLRGLALAHHKRVDVYMDESTLERAREAFGYCFNGAKGYPPILDAHVIVPGEPLDVEGAGGTLRLTPFAQHHGRITSLGFRIGDLAYSSDLHDLPAESLPLLRGLEVWIVDALRHTAHSSHFTVEEALEWSERIGTRRAVLTNLHHDLDYEMLNRSIPDWAEPAYDMMVLELTPAS
ncbi:MBL fold metallo-hydrolase [Acuticoccus sp. I52.16.1]|uniref:MBL fold metallo-hydrolase n=1 Tax=Acuticoccus sp. I52.16.1 TaxID=2928472 RepID=UPI001FD12A62|nr:MBL fold metallo-hydrolase [Acuticoccus sp. I52.16.1]UOM34578.1 MBL fold metallo-hydrolase [Acuticoccus sp. I52.16.1]